MTDEGEEPPAAGEKRSDDDPPADDAVREPETAERDASKPAAPSEAHEDATEPERPASGGESAGNEPRSTGEDATASAAASSSDASPTADVADDSDSRTEEVNSTPEAIDGDGPAPADDETTEAGPSYGPGVPEDVRTYDRFTKIDGSTYERANEFLRERTYITAREWAIARLCADFRTETGVEMTKIGEHLPELVPFMTDTYSPQAVNQARAAFEDKVRKSGATFLYGAMSDFFTAEELDDVMYEATEVAKFLLEVEGVDLTVEEELEAEDRISEVMREVREHSAALRHDEVVCPECGHQIRAEDD